MPIAYTRMCWYSDVVDGDWVIDYSPEYPALMIASGGAGHAFKVGPAAFLCFESCPKVLHLCRTGRYFTQNFELTRVISFCPSSAISSAPDSRTR